MSTPTATNAATAAKVNEVISCVIPVANPIWMTGAEQNGYSRRHRLSHLKIYDHLMTNSLKFIINLIIKSEFEYVPSCLPSFLPFLRHSTIRASRDNRRMPTRHTSPDPCIAISLANQEPTVGWLLHKLQPRYVKRIVRTSERT